MDLVYCLKRGASYWNDNEIRFSLRSVAKHLRIPVRHVYFFGDKPDFLKDVCHVPMEDAGDKARNLMAKYKAMSESAELSDPFLLLDDDHIFLQPTTEIPLMANGRLEALVHRQWVLQKRAYGAYLHNALVLLRRKGLPERNYQIHYPILVHKEPMREVVRMAEGTSTVMGSLYGNLVREPTVETDHDFRLNSVAHWYRTKDGPFVSIEERLKFVALDKRTGKAQVVHVAPFIQKRFPDPSPWEVS